MTHQRLESVLSLLTGRHRAAEITGDLLEQHTGGLSFWWAACRLILALTWRPVLGIFCALIAFLFAGYPFGLAWQHAGSPVPHTGWQWLAFGTVHYSMLAWAIACMALFQCGVRSATAAAACVVAALLTLESCSFDVPPLQLAAMVACAFVVLLMTLMPAHRDQIGMLIRAALAAGIVATAWNQAYAAVLRSLPAGMGAPFAFSGMVLAFFAGWLAMSTPWKLGPHPDQRAKA